MCWHVTNIVAIMVIAVVKWHWRWDAFNGLTMLIVATGVTMGICSCMTRMTQISGSTRLVPEVLRTFKHQLHVKRDITAAFLPHQGQPLAWGFVVVMILVTNVAFILWHFGLSRLVAINVNTICHLACEYHRFLQLAAWTTWLGIAIAGALCTGQCKYILLFIHYEKG